MKHHLIVINGGSSSVRFKLYRCDQDDLELGIYGTISGIGRNAQVDIRSHDGKRIVIPQELAHVENHQDAFDVLIDWLEVRGEAASIVAAGHRIVHGGGRYVTPVIIDNETLEELKSFSALAPHHQPHNISAIKALRARMPGIPQVACFDTGFHDTMPVDAQLLGLPKEYQSKGMRRYGFHGLSYAYVASAFQDITGVPLPERVVMAHLGNGASLCALLLGKSIATTMGFSTLDGLPMGSRSGAIDPGALIHLLREDGMSLSKLEDILYNRCGLLGISGITSDMRELLQSETSDAQRALDYYVYKLLREIGSMAAALQGVDALVFCGGIGENAWQIRAEVIKRLSWLGFKLDEDANKNGATCLTVQGNTGPTAWVIQTDEEKYIARQSLACLQEAGLHTCSQG
jgi:acetate kinase